MQTKDWIKYVSVVRKQYPFGPIKYTRNMEGNLHNINGPAVITPTYVCDYDNGQKHGVYADIYGTVLHYFRNVLIPSRYITNPDSVTIDEIIHHSNAEVRAVGVRLYGFERLLQEEKLDVIHIDDKKQMLLQWNAKDPDESFGIVRVFDATPRPDGTREIYYLVVPPGMSTVKQAIAWTFGKEESEYNPSVET